MAEIRDGLFKKRNEGGHSIHSYQTENVLRAIQRDIN